MNFGRVDMLAVGLGIAFLGVACYVANTIPEVAGFSFTIGGAALGAVIGRLMTPPPAESPWIDAAISSYRQIGSTVRSLERFKTDCLPDCADGQNAAIVEFCRQTKHSLTSSTDQLRNVQEDWRDFVQAHCFDCATYMDRMDGADAQLPLASDKGLAP